MEAERAIGRLEAKVSGIESNITELKQDVKTLLAWRWKLWGVTAAASAVFTVLTEIILSVFAHK